MGGSTRSTATTTPQSGPDRPPAAAGIDHVGRPRSRGDDHLLRRDPLAVLELDPGDATRCQPWTSGVADADVDPEPRGARGPRVGGRRGTDRIADRDPTGRHAGAERRLQRRARRPDRGTSGQARVGRHAGRRPTAGQPPGRGSRAAAPPAPAGSANRLPEPASSSSARYMRNVSRCRSTSTGSNGCWTTPELRPDAPAATAVRSSSTTRRPVAASSAAADDPDDPAADHDDVGRGTRTVGGATAIVRTSPAMMARAGPTGPNGGGHKDAPTGAGASFARRSRAGDGRDRPLIGRAVSPVVA